MSRIDSMWRRSFPGRASRNSWAAADRLSPNPPKVSIVLPTYNGNRYLAESINSILAQTFTRWELIVVDDCSSDDTPAIVRSFTDSRIHYVRNGTNCKLPRSLNRGFALATGRYLTWTSDDNRYAPTALERMAAALDLNPKTDLVCANYVLIDGAGEVVGRQELQPSIMLPEVDSVGACFMYRRRVLEETGAYDPDWTLVEDYEYWLRVHNRFRISVINEDLYYYRFHGASLTGTTRKQKIVDLADQVRKARSSPRRKFDLWLYRQCLVVSDWVRASRLRWILLPVRYLNGCVLRFYQKYFYVEGRV